MFTTALVGKAGIHFYRAVKAGNAFAKPTAVGQFYKGGFEKTMTASARVWARCSPPLQSTLRRWSC